ncbi:MAG: hypothetical protein C3F15_08130 [Holophagae bacterium]|nr:MAG: hypothetical protein C3F15_08130 [Holophagae bacterium]
MDGTQVAKGRIANTMPTRISIDEAFDVGADTGAQVGEAHDVSFKFTGKLERGAVHLGESKLTTADQRVVNVAETRRRAGV